jgi:hypothetical protein
MAWLFAIASTGFNPYSTYTIINLEGTEAVVPLKMKFSVGGT